MKIISTSTNEAKQAAIRNVAEALFPGAEITALKVETGVSTTPMTDDEGIRGALNRIHEARKMDAVGDLYVGLEGILTTNEFGSFICGWAVVESADGRRAFGCSGKVQLPPVIALHIKDFKELSDEVKERYSSDLVHEMSKIGSNGVITNRHYTRVDEFEDALMCALGYFANPTNYMESVS